MRNFKTKIDEDKLLELHKKQTHREMNEQMNKKEFKTLSDYREASSAFLMDSCKLKQQL